MGSVAFFLSSAQLLVGLERGAITVENSTVGGSSKQLKIELPCGPAVPFLGTHPKEWEHGFKQKCVHRVHKSQEVGITLGPTHGRRVRRGGLHPKGKSSALKGEF